MASAVISVADRLAPLRRFVSDFAGLIDAAPAPDRLPEGGAALLRALVARDDWLPASHALPHPERYQQYLLHRDPAGRFSVVSFVWGPGQATPIHDHRVWGLVGVLRGAEIDQRYDAAIRPLGDPVRLEAGAVARLGPADGDIHRVVNAFHDRTSISIHVYGADIATVRRAAYAADGTASGFVSAYADAPDLAEALR